MAYSRQTPNVFASNGNPNGSVAGNAAAAAGGVPPDLCWDYTNAFLYVCTATGSTSTATWTVISASTGSNSYWGGTAGGTANALTLTIASPAIPALADGMQFRFIGGSSANTAGATMAINGGATVSIVTRGNAALAANSIRPGYAHTLTYSGTLSKFELMDPFMAAGAFWGGTAGGTANALTIMTGASLPALVTGMMFDFIVSASGNTGATTIAIDGLTTVAVQLNGAAIPGGALVASTIVHSVYDGANLQILGSAIPGNYWGGTAGGSANALTCSTGYGLTAMPKAGVTVALKTAGTPNTGASTLAVDSIGTKTIQKNGVATANGDLPASTTILFESDGTNWQMISGGGSGASYASIYGALFAF